MIEPQIVNANYKSCTSGFIDRRSFNKVMKEEKSRKSGQSQQFGERRNTQTAVTTNRSSVRDGLRSMLGGGKPSGPLQPRVVTAENDL